MNQASLTRLQNLLILILLLIFLCSCSTWKTSVKCFTLWTTTWMYLRARVSTWARSISKICQHQWSIDTYLTNVHRNLRKLDSSSQVIHELDWEDWTEKDRLLNHACSQSLRHALASLRLQWCKQESILWADCTKSQSDHFIDEVKEVAAFQEFNLMFCETCNYRQLFSFRWRLLIEVQKLTEDDFNWADDDQVDVFADWYVHLCSFKRFLFLLVQFSLMMKQERRLCWFFDISFAATELNWHSQDSFLR